LNDVSFTVEKGETVGIIGRNGAGKSTLLQIISNTLSASSGSVEVNGRVAALLELGAGFNPEFTGKENVYMNASILGLSTEEIDARYQDILDFADIGDFIDQPVKTYSSGMYVRLAFSVIAHVDADILIVDEALAVGDIFFTQKCMRFLKSFMKTGTVLFVSHDTSMIQSLCDKAIILEKGKVIKEGSAKEVSEYYVKMQYSAVHGLKSLDNGRSHSQENKASRGKVLEDCRKSIIDNSNLKNIIEVFEFDDKSESFGAGGAEIKYVSIVNENGENASVLYGNDKVTISATVETLIDFNNMIVGFFVNNKYGQRLFGDNTLLSCLDEKSSFKSGELVIANFTFVLPVLPKGDYTISIAVADGDQDNHVQHVWMHDALAVKSISSHLSHGLIALPMEDISLNKAI
jgi:lipopolysaccharide transport system ATP-binding protein